MVMKNTKQQKISQEGGFAYQVFISAILVSSYFCCYLYNWNWIRKTAKSTAVVRKHCCMLHGVIHADKYGNKILSTHCFTNLLLALH